jgi:hypothetical protein
MQVIVAHFLHPYGLSANAEMHYKIIKLAKVFKD